MSFWGGKIPQAKRDLARLLLAEDRTYREVAEALEISIGSVHNITREPVEKIGCLVEEIKKRFSLKRYILSDYILSSISDRDLSRASLRDKVAASAILAEKAKLLEQRSKKAPGECKNPERSERENGTEDAENALETGSSGDGDH